LGSPVNLQPPLLVLQGEEAALGVEMQADHIQAYCLRGSCTLHLGNISASFGPAAKLAFSMTEDSIDELLPVALDEPDRSTWFDLCSTWHPETETVIGECQMVLP
jgi:hypothetical protein